MLYAFGGGTRSSVYDHASGPYENPAAAVNAAAAHYGLTPGEAAELERRHVVQFPHARAMALRVGLVEIFGVAHDWVWTPVEARKWTWTKP